MISFTDFLKFLPHPELVDKTERPVTPAAIQPQVALLFAPEPAQQQFSCFQLAEEIIAKITKNKAYRVLDTEGGRDASGMLDVNRELVVGKQHISLAHGVWESVRAYPVSHELKLALGIVTRRLGLGAELFNEARRHQFEDLDAACNRALQIVHQTLGSMAEDREAWIFIQKLMTADELGISLKEIKDQAVEPLWHMNPAVPTKKCYPFEAIRRLYGKLREPKELLETGHPFGTVMAVYEILVQDLNRIHDDDIVTYITKMAPCHQISLIQTVQQTLECTIPDGTVKKSIEGIKVQPEPLHQPTPPSPAKIINTILEEETFNEIRTAITTTCPGPAAKIEAGHKTVGAVFFDKDDQDSLLFALANKFVNIPQEVFEQAFLTFIDGHNIVFTDDAKEVWDPENRMHVLLYLATSVPLQERGRFLRGKPYDLYRPKNVQVVDKATESADNSSFIKDVRKAKRHLTEEHLIELHRISKIQTSGYAYTVSDSLKAAINSLKVQQPIRLLVEDLVMGVNYPLERLGIRLKVPSKALPTSCKDLVSFIWKTAEAVDDTTTICGNEDIKELRSKMVLAAQDQFSNPRKIFERSDALIDSLCKSIQEARKYLIEERVIETAVKDILSYFKVTKHDVNYTKNSDIQKWFSEVEPTILDEEQSRPTGCEGINRDEQMALSKALVEWRIAQVHTFEPGASGKIIEAVPCLFIQSIAYSEHKRLFPWCALMSKRGLEAVVRSSQEQTEQAALIELLKEATGQDLDFQLCKTQGVALDPAELLSLLRKTSQTLRDGNKVVMLAQFLKPTSSGQQLAKSASSANINQAQEALIRHPGLLVISEDTQEKQRLGAQGTTAQQKEVQKIELPDWAQELYDDGTHLYQAANKLIEQFAQEALGQMQKRKLEDVIQREELPLLPSFDTLVQPKEVDGYFHLSLRDYQKRSVLRCKMWHEHGLNGLLCLDTGLGKTRVASELLFQRLLEDPTSRCLVVAPNAVKPQWKYEFERSMLLATLTYLLPNYRKRECLQLLAQILYTHREYIFELLPPITMEHKAKIISKLPLLSDSLPPYHAKNEQQRVEQLTTVLSLENCIREYAATELHLKVVLEAFYPEPQESIIDRSFLEKLAALHDAFRTTFVTVLNKPQDLSKAITSNLPGIYVCAESQLTTLLKQEEEAKKLKAFAPSLIVLDEAHQLLTQKHDGKELIIKQLMRAWQIKAKPMVVALTATPIVNEMADLTQLLTLMNSEKVSSSLIARFEMSVELLKRELQSARKTFDELHNKVSIDDSFTLATEQGIKRALFNIAWLKSKLFDPLIEKVSWEDEEVQGLGRDKMPIVLTVKKVVEPVGRQMELVKSVIQKFKHSFLEKTDQIERCLIHPEFFSEQNIDSVIDKFCKMSSDQKEAFIQQSATLRTAFCDEASELTTTLGQRQKALIYVKHQKTAEFVRHIVTWKYGLDDQTVFVVHSNVAKRDQIIENFKQITGRAAVLILLPKSGGTGLNFTNVVLNYMMTTEWTHEKDKQAKARILRGVGERTIVSLQHKIPERKHILMVAKKKRYFSDLLLPSNGETLQSLLCNLLNTVEAMVRANEKHAVASDTWRAFFKDQVGQITTKFVANKIALEREYLHKQAQLSSTKELTGYYVSPSRKCHLAYSLIPMPDSQERPPYLRIVQIGLEQCQSGNSKTRDEFLKQQGSKEVLAQWVRKNFKVQGGLGNDPNAYIDAIQQNGGALYTYEWADGQWGSHLVRKETKGNGKDPAKVIEILKDKNDYYLLTLDESRNKPFNFA